MIEETSVMVGKALVDIVDSNFGGNHTMIIFRDVINIVDRI